MERFLFIILVLISPNLNYGNIIWKELDNGLFCSDNAKTVSDFPAGVNNVTACQEECLLNTWCLAIVLNTTTCQLSSACVVDDVAPSPNYVTAYRIAFDTYPNITNHYTCQPTDFITAVVPATVHNCKSECDNDSQCEAFYITQDWCMLYKPCVYDPFGTTLYYSFYTSGLTSAPSATPTSSPTNPTKSPTETPTSSPTPLPTDIPTESPSKYPSISPTVSPTSFPSASPTLAPTQKPTASPTNFPSASPTLAPTQKPSVSPTNFPSASPTLAPTQKPSVSPSDSPNVTPTFSPSQIPIAIISASPTIAPSTFLSINPTLLPPVGFRNITNTATTQSNNTVVIVASIIGLLLALIGLVLLYKRKNNKEYKNITYNM